MLERDFNLLYRASQRQDLKQQFLVGALRIGFHAAKALGLRDIPIGGIETQSFEDPQVKNLLVLGFHAELGMSREQYVDGMPPLPLQPESFRDRFNLPVLVDPRVSLSRQLKIHKPIGVLTDLSDSQVTKMAFSILQNCNTSHPYYIWAEEKITYNNLGSLAWNEEPINVIEALALIRECKDIFRKLSSFDFDLGNLLSEDRIASIRAAGSSVPGPLGFRELREDIKILTEGYFEGADDPRLYNAFILKGKNV